MSEDGGALGRTLAPLFALSWLVSRAMAALCCALLAFIAAAIVYDVTVRNLGLQPPNFTVSFTEYVLLYTTMLGAPYMVRKKGHILVEALIESVGPALHRAMARFVYFVCTLLSAALTYYGAKLLLQGIATNDLEIRSFDMPRWILDVTLPLGFGISTIEFLRYLVGVDTLYKVKAQDKDGF
jgi:TRAP-type C4-dicarboxylate transport system permease small subunit